jgi:hypothetical protein
MVSNLSSLMTLIRLGVERPAAPARPRARRVGECERGHDGPPFGWRMDR